METEANAIDSSDAAVAIGHHPQGQQRVADTRLDPHEERQQHAGGREHRDRQRVAPAMGLRVGEAEHEREQPAGHGQRPSQVDPLLALGGLVAQQRDPAGAGDDGKEQVDVHDRAPVEDLGEHAAEQEAHRCPTAGDGAEDAERPAALLGVDEGGRQQRQRRRRQQRAEQSLQHARAGQHRERSRGTADGGRDREARQAADERPLAAEDVADLAAEQEHAAEGERIAGDDPLALVVGEAEGLLGRGQGNVHDGGVQHDHELGDAEDREDQPPAVVVGAAGGVHVVGSLFLTELDTCYPLTAEA